MSSSYAIADHDTTVEYDLEDTGISGNYDLSDEYIAYHTDPDLHLHTYKSSFVEQDPGSSIQPPQRKEDNASTESFYFFCGCCGKQGPIFNREMITFKIGELRVKEDLILCCECRSNCFPDLEAWRCRGIFKEGPTIPWSPGFMVRVLSPRSLHGGRLIDAPENKVPKSAEFVCWLIPSIPSIWPLWSAHDGTQSAEIPSVELAREVVDDDLEDLSEGSDHRNGKKVERPKKFYRCALCSYEKSKPSRFVDHIARYMGRYRSKLCTEEEIEKESDKSPNKYLPINLFGRKDYAKKHILDTTRFEKYHGRRISEDKVYDYIDLNPQDNILERGLATWREKSGTDIILAEAIAVGVFEPPTKPPSTHHTTRQTILQRQNQVAGSQS
ncbi:hypothetical protein TWF679_009724 [Orbilia oligospora]|uniref:Uncharacterized protein n=1 Tax=Orbilia oligospora TaxID=2813651 RepID=A0A8H8VJJ1_ORBOL|nr:hypothetical protein TWF679_009724 [Orbilia oligospora]